MKNLSETSVQFVKGVGPVKKTIFERLNIHTIEDLLYFFPRRYEDRRNLTTIAQVKVGEWQAVCGKIINPSAHRSWFTRKHVTELILDDGSGRISCVWFNRPYLATYLKPDSRMVCYGKVGMYKNRLQIVSPEYEIIEKEEDEYLSLKRIVPIYSLTRGISQRFLRKIIHSALEVFKDQLKDDLPVWLRNKCKLANIKRSISMIHFPQDFEEQEEAMRRVSFEEFFFFQVSIILRRLSLTHKNGISHKISEGQTLQFVNNFPFELTKAQKRSIKEIKDDMTKPSPMLRLLQGDVGSGKTVVAFFGCYNAHLNGFQSAFMAPTEVLARQHHENIQRMIESKKFGDIKITLLTSSLKDIEKEEILKKIREGKIDLVIGTHALLTADVKFKNLSFIVVDEQHKFGVQQRALLSEKGLNPHILIMTATPIPRTLCITLYGDLDLSVLDELPAGRKKIATQLHTEETATDVYQFVHKKIKEGRQAYIVYPLIEESEEMDLKAAKAMFKQFKDNEFKDCRLGLMHGRLKVKETEEIMQKFKNKEIDVLVATTVIEVGVDVPNATVMVIEHAERFGLAQLHQLRGRIGRGTQEGHCLLIAEATTQDAQKRLDAILSTTDGFKIAEEDLKIRGPGYFFGRSQHGISELKVANPATQMDILQLARQEALAMTKEDPKLAKPENRDILLFVKKRYPTFLEMVEAG